MIDRGIVIPHHNIVRAVEAVGVVADHMLRHLPVFTACAVVLECEQND